jgi:hypothetical protein
VDGVVVMRRQRPKRRLAAHGGEGTEHGVHGACRRCSTILRVEWRREDALAAKFYTVFEGLPDARLALAHREVDDHIVGEPLLQRLRLAPSDCSER